MISWFPVRMVSVLTLVALICSATALLRTLETNADGQEAIHLAETLADEIDSRSMFPSPFRATIQPPHGYNGRGMITIHPSSIRAEVGETEYSTHLISRSHLWMPGDRDVWTCEELEEMDEEHTFLEVRGELTMEKKEISVDGITVITTFLYSQA